MKAAIFFLVLVTLAGSGDVPLPERSYKILMLLPVSTRSHTNVLVALAEALAHRGHKIMMLTNHPSQSAHPNIVEVQHGLTHMALGKRNIFQERKNSSPSGFTVIQKILPAMARDLYKIVYPFVHELPFITVAVVGMDERQSAVLGNVLNPSYVSNLMTRYPFPMSFWQRLKNTALHFWVSFYWRHCGVIPRVQEEISVQFPDLPPLLDIERNQSLTLLNTHFSISTPVPLLPSQVEVGAIHCRPGKPLPQNTESWLGGAGSAGVIYFSLGSLTRGDSMMPEHLHMFLEAFRRLPQRILWKYEGKLEGASDNVEVNSWLPQQDILAHYNVKVFISHGGLVSLQESIFHSKPLLVLPIFGDQPKNGMFVEDSGIGRMLMWEELTVDRIVAALKDMISNPKYKENVARMSASLRDQPTTPQERAVFWTEYVIRHRGAPQLRSPAAQLSWVEFLMLDVVGLLLLALLLLLLLISRLLRGISATLLVGSAKKKRD